MCVGGGVGGWVSESHTGVIVLMFILTICMSALCLIWPKSGLSEFWKTCFSNSQICLNFYISCVIFLVNIMVFRFYV